MTNKTPKQALKPLTRQQLLSQKKLRRSWMKAIRRLLQQAAEENGVVIMPEDDRRAITID